MDTNDIRKALEAVPPEMRGEVLSSFFTIAAAVAATQKFPGAPREFCERSLSMMMPPEQVAIGMAFMLDQKLVEDRDGKLYILPRGAGMIASLDKMKAQRDAAKAGAAAAAGSDDSMAPVTPRSRIDALLHNRRN